MGASQLSVESNPSDFIDSLNKFSKEHRAQRWEGSLSDFLTHILPTRPAAFVRTSHEYIWDMLLWHGRSSEGDDTHKARELFKRELYGVDEPLGRVVDYFKAAAAGSDVGRRLLLLLGPPPAASRRWRSCSSAGSKNTAAPTRARCMRSRARPCASRL